MVPSKLNNWAFDTVPQSQSQRPVGYQPAARGSAAPPAINAMVYICGHRSDYDQWASLATRLVVADVSALLQALGRQCDFGGDYHGKGGPLPSTNCAPITPVQQTFLQAAREAQFSDPRGFQCRGSRRPRPSIR